MHTRTAATSVLCFRALHFDAPPFSFLLFPTLASLFAHFHHGRKGVADGVSIDLSKWDNKQPRECNEQKQKRLPRKQTQHGRRTTKQTVVKAAPAHHALLQNNMYCPFISHPPSFSLVCMRSASKRRHVHVLLLLRAILTTVSNSFAAMMEVSKQGSKGGEEQK